MLNLKSAARCFAAILLLVCCWLALPGAAWAAAAAGEVPVYFVDDDFVTVVSDEQGIGVNTPLAGYSANAIARDGTTYLPLREISERLGAAVAYDGATKTITISSGGSTLSLQAGSLTATRRNADGTVDAIPMAQPVLTLSGISYVPLRTAGTVLGQEVEYLPNTKGVIIYRTAAERLLLARTAALDLPNGHGFFWDTYRGGVDKENVVEFPLGESDRMIITRVEGYNIDSFDNIAKIDTYYKVEHGDMVVLGQRRLDANGAIVEQRGEPIPVWADAVRYVNIRPNTYQMWARVRSGGTYLPDADLRYRMLGREINKYGYVPASDEDPHFTSRLIILPEEMALLEAAEGGEYSAVTGTPAGLNITQYRVDKRNTATLTDANGAQTAVPITLSRLNAPLQDGKLYVLVRELADPLGAATWYDEATHKARLTYNGQTWELSPGSQPLDEVCKMLGLGYKYLPEADSVVVYSSENERLQLTRQAALCLPRDLSRGTALTGTGQPSYTFEFPLGECDRVIVTHPADIATYYQVADGKLVALGQRQLAANGAAAAEWGEAIPAWPDAVRYEYNSGEVKCSVRSGGAYLRELACSYTVAWPSSGNDYLLAIPGEAELLAAANGGK